MRILLFMEACCQITYNIKLSAHRQKPELKRLEFYKALRRNVEKDCHLQSGSPEGLDTFPSKSTKLFLSCRIQAQPVGTWRGARRVAGSNPDHISWSYCQGTWPQFGPRALNTAAHCSWFQMCVWFTASDGLNAVVETQCVHDDNKLLYIQMKVIDLPANMYSFKMYSSGRKHLHLYW